MKRDAINQKTGWLNGPYIMTNFNNFYGIYNKNSIIKQIKMIIYKRKIHKEMSFDVPRLHNEYNGLESLISKSLLLPIR